MAFADPVTLRGEHVVLVPLTQAHAPDLARASRDGDLSALWYTSVPAPEQVGDEIERRLAWQSQGSMLPFAVVDPADERAVGMTSFCRIDAANRRVEIGYTWYAKRVQRTALNTECKRLMLAYAFETLDCIAVEFRTHWMNRQSRTAIARLGAKQDGVLRNHQIASDGTLRDTVVFSIIASEWPAVKSHLTHQLTCRPTLGRHSADFG